MLRLRAHCGGRMGKIGRNHVKWLPDMDLNHDKQIQSLLCYRYTIGQCTGMNVRVFIQESSC